MRPPISTIENLLERHRTSYFDIVKDQVVFECWHLDGIPCELPRTPSGAGHLRVSCVVSMDEIENDRVNLESGKSQADALTSMAKYLYDRKFEE